jgi:hypothetical protein
MDWDLGWLRCQAREAVELGTELGVENKTDSEIWQETDELVMQALLTAINRYNEERELRPFDTPESLYRYLWQLLYEDEASRTEMMDVTEEAKERLQDELEKVADFIEHEYDRRLYEFEKMEAQQ